MHAWMRERERKREIETKLDACLSEREGEEERVWDWNKVRYTFLRE
jgi:hypothetical protein